MAEKLRWRLAHALNRLPWTCWADLVDFALNDRATRRRLGYRLLDTRIDDLCHEDAAANGVCYCNKVKRQVTT